MSLGIFAMILLGLLATLFVDRRTRGRIAVTAVSAFLLGLVVAASNGVLTKPSHALVDGVRTGMTAIGESLGGGK
ncbi:hypothetical protein Drose_06880 [Dactylosporangium roseum]|uniref:Uncharacterized protein n=1 Tax=Dactylosporangium roseum TaxID=47989 RepID=A0ABY5Z7F2_9ACTN|nr:hypothetical protein [Dactylosporangium roseum]UWZ37989.1 hypothetical protein Drose_06880 [Dactylosporangium roseum]